MIRIIDDRSTGKTGRLMLLAKDTGALFVCGNPHAMEQKAHAYGITGINFISYYDFLDSSKWRGNHKKTPVVIDEMEAMVKYENPMAEVIGYSISEDD